MLLGKGDFGARTDAVERSLRALGKGSEGSTGHRENRPAEAATLGGRPCLPVTEALRRPLPRMELTQRTLRTAP